MLVVDIQESHRSKIYSFTSFYGQGRYNDKALGSLLKKKIYLLDKRTGNLPHSMAEIIFSISTVLNHCLINFSLLHTFVVFH